MSLISNIHKDDVISFANFHIGYKLPLGANSSRRGRAKFSQDNHKIDNSWRGGDFIRQSEIYFYSFHLIFGCAEQLSIHICSRS
jgi:hypothetical protein